MNYLVMLLFPFLFGEFQMPEHCVPTTADIPQTRPVAEQPVGLMGRLTSVIDTARENVGENAVEVLRSGYSSRTALELAMIRKNPSFLLPSAMAGFWAGTISAEVCPRGSGLGSNGGRNALFHSVQSAFLSASIGQSNGCKLMMAHENIQNHADTWMDLKNNLVGNIHGTRNRALFAGCFEMLNTVFQLNQQFGARKINRTNVSDMGGIRPLANGDGVSFSDLLRVFGISTTSLPPHLIPRNSNICTELVQYIKQNMVQELVALRPDECATENNMPVYNDIPGPELLPYNGFIDTLTSLR